MSTKSPLSYETRSLSIMACAAINLAGKTMVKASVVVAAACIADRVNESSTTRADIRRDMLSRLTETKPATFQKIWASGQELAVLYRAEIAIAFEELRLGRNSRITTVEYYEAAHAALSRIPNLIGSWEKLQVAVGKAPVVKSQGEKDAAKVALLWKGISAETDSTTLLYLADLARTRHLIMEAFRLGVRLPATAFTEQDTLLSRLVELTNTRFGVGSEGEEDGEEDGGEEIEEAAPVPAPENVVLMLAAPVPLSRAEAARQAMRAMAEHKLAKVATDAEDAKAEAAASATASEAAFHAHALTMKEAEDAVAAATALAALGAKYAPKVSKARKPRKVA